MISYPTFQDFSRRIVELFRRPFLKHDNNLDFRNSESYKNNIFQKGSGDVLFFIFVTCLGVSKDENNSFGGLGTRRKSRNHRSEEFEVLP